MRLPSLVATAPFVVWLGSSLPASRIYPDAGVAHAVTMHLESFTGKGVVAVHLSSVPFGLRATDTSRVALDTLTVRTPADVRVTAEANRVELRTEGNLAVRVTFTDGASSSERAIRAWGRRLLFVRVDGDFQQSAEVLPALP